MLQRLRDQVSVRRVTAVALSVLLVLGGVYAVRSISAGALFEPNSAVQALRKNQVNFPDEDTSPATGGEEEGDTWQRADDAPDIHNPETTPEAPGKIQVPSNMLPPGTDLPSDPSSDGTGGDAGIIVSPGGDGSNGTITIPGGNGNDTIPGGGEDTPGDNGGNGSGNGNGGGENGGGSSSGQPDDSTPADSVPEVPDVKVDPDTLPQNPYENISGDDRFDPETGISDPEHERYRYRLDVSFDRADAAIRLYSDSLARFYRGQSISAADFFQNAIFNVVQVPTDDSDGDFPRSYRVTSYGENFRVGNFPSVAEGDSVAATFYFRVNADSDWQKLEVEFPVEDIEIRLLVDSAARSGELTDAVLTGSGDAEYGKPVRLYPGRSGVTLDLSRWFFRAQPKRCWTRGEDGLYHTDITQLFTGWSLTQDGESIGNSYTVPEGASGLILLYPTELQDVPEGFTCILGELTMADSLLLQDETDAYTSHYLTAFYYQKLTALPEDNSLDWGTFDLDDGDDWGNDWGDDGSAVAEWVIPQGIQWISAAPWSPGESLTLPDSVLKIPIYDPDDWLGEAIYVNQGFFVAENNPCFTSVDGILYSKDKTKILGIPLNLQELTVGPQVQELVLSYWNSSLMSLTFQGTTPPDMHPEYLPSMADLYVPEEAAIAYFDLFVDRLNSEYYSGMLYTFNAQGETQPVALQEKNGLILSLDGSELYLIRSSVQGTCILPEGIETVRTGALDKASGITGLLLPESLRQLESGSLCSETLASAIFLGHQPPQVAEGAFLENTILFVSAGDEESYFLAWGNDIAFSVGDFNIVNRDGWKYLQETVDGQESVTLLGVPEDLERFDAANLPDVTLTAIGDYAFSGCTALKIVILPESVKTIGNCAFEGCTALEAVDVQSRDHITVAPSALTIGNSFLDYHLRFVVFHAPEAEFGNFNNYYAHIFAPADGVGYPSYTLDNDFFDDYVLCPAGEGILLYSTPGSWQHSEGYPVYTKGRVLIGGTTNISGEIDCTDVILVMNGAFSNCANAFTLKNTDYIWDIGYQSFARSGVAGDLHFPALYAIAAEGFTQCKNITSLDLGQQLEIINSGAFYGCSGLTDFTVPESVFRLGDVFVGSCGLDHITFLSEEAPVLVGQYGGFVFSDLADGTADPDFRVKLDGNAAGHELDYVLAWRDALTPYGGELLDGENAARRLLGLPEVETLTPGGEEEDPFPDDSFPENPGEDGSDPAPAPDEQTPQDPDPTPDPGPGTEDPETPAPAPEPELPAPSGDGEDETLPPEGSANPEDPDPAQEPEPNEGGAPTAPEEGGTL